MTPEQIDRVFGRGRLKMVTGEHVEVFREAVAPGERRRYTKRFLNSTDGDFAQWTEREWRILARLVGHGITCVPEIVQFDRGSVAGTQHVQTYDAGVTVDQWATLLPLYRDGSLYRHAFEDCAHWWALGHHCLIALKEIHQLQLVHLDIKGDNVCIPVGPANYDPDAPEASLFPAFGQLALIDFAFSLVSRENLTAPLPIGWQREYDYQSPRLLKALEDGHDGDLARTRELDWRCDIYSLAAMLKRYLPDEGMVQGRERATGWTNGRYEAAKALILTLREHHDRDTPQVHPHQGLIDATGAQLQENDLVLSLAAGWTFARDFQAASTGASPLTPMTRLAVPLRVPVSPRGRTPADVPDPVVAPREAATPVLVTPRGAPVRPHAARHGAWPAALAAAMLLGLGAVVAHEAFPDAARTLIDVARTWRGSLPPPLADSAPPAANDAGSQSGPAAQDTAAAPASAERSGTNSAAADAPPSAAAASAQELPSAQTAQTDADQASHATSAPADQALDPESAAAAKPAATDPTPPPQVAQQGLQAPARAEAKRAPGKRVAAKAAPPPAARAAKPVATARPQPRSRLAIPSQRALPATGGARVSTKPAPVAAQSPRAAPVSGRVAELTAPVKPATMAESPSPAGPPDESIAASNPVAVQGPRPATAEAIAPSNASPTQGPQSASAGEASPATAPAAPVTARREGKPPKSALARTETGPLSQLLGLAKRTPAPIEDRSAPVAAMPDRTPAAPQTPAPAPAPAPAPDRRVAAAPTAEAPPSSATFTIAVEEAQAQARAQSSPASPSAARATAVSPAGARMAIASPASRAPRVLSPPPPLPDVPPDYVSADRARETDFAQQARRTLVQAVPRVAAEAQREVSRVLSAAANAHELWQERTVVERAREVWVRESMSGSSPVVDPVAARRFNDEARKAYVTRGNVVEAFDLQLRAFGANPNDPDIAGNLAALHLMVSPSRAETARQLALHAIAARGGRHRAGRLEDWNTFAVASALTGRDADARNAFYVTVALARNVERNCRDAATAIASYGERVRAPVEAMLYRIYVQGRTYESPHCAWPPKWAAARRVD